MKNCLTFSKAIDEDRLLKTEEGFHVKNKTSEREEELTKKGWMKQNTIGEPRLSECVDLYKSLGYEVHLEPINPNEMSEDCRRCFEKDKTVRTIFTRKE